MGEIGCLKDANFQNLGTTKLLVDDLDIRNRLPDNVIFLANANVDLTKNTLNITNTAADGDHVLTLPALSTLENGDFITLYIGVLMGADAHEYQVTCDGSDKIYGNVTLGNALAPGAAVTNGAGLTNNVQNIEIVNKGALKLGGNTSANAAGAEGSLITLTVIKGTTDIWWASGNLVTAHDASTGAAVIA